MKLPVSLIIRRLKSNEYIWCLLFHSFKTCSLMKEVTAKLHVFNIQVQKNFTVYLYGLLTKLDTQTVILIIINIIVVVPVFFAFHLSHFNLIVHTKVIIHLYFCSIYLFTWLQSHESPLELDDEKQTSRNTRTVKQKSKCIVCTLSLGEMLKVTARQIEENSYVQNIK